MCIVFWEGTTAGRLGYSGNHSFGSKTRHMLYPSVDREFIRVDWVRLCDYHCVAHEVKQTIVYTGNHMKLHKQLCTGNHMKLHKQLCTGNHMKLHKQLCTGNHMKLHKQLCTGNHMKLNKQLCTGNHMK